MAAVCAVLLLWGLRYRRRARRTLRSARVEVHVGEYIWIRILTRQVAILNNVITAPLACKRRNAHAIMLSACNLHVAHAATLQHRQFDSRFPHLSYM